jgi:hypothetical protein
LGDRKHTLRDRRRDTTWIVFNRLYPYTNFRYSISILINTFPQSSLTITYTPCIVVSIVNIGCFTDPTPFTLTYTAAHLVTSAILNTRSPALRTELELSLFLQIPDQFAVIGILVLSFYFDTRLSMMIRTN